uniref:Chlororespiratory reduction 2 n=1 Tax=Cypripedium formosanum TaxID=53042 RepID=A0A0F7J281_9ASPA|nr:chlororespiratory reduction 2 [Cypripedium formosanum]
MVFFCTHPYLPTPTFVPKPHNLHLRSLFCLQSPIEPSSSSPSPTHSITTNNYNHLIQSLCSQGNLTQAFKLLPREASPTQRTFESLILACTRHNATSYAPAIDRRLSAADGLHHDPFLSTKLIEMYSHFSALDDARNVFDRTPQKTIFVWNALLKAIVVVSNDGEEALSLFTDMGGKGVHFDSFSYSYVLKACLASSLHVSVVLRRVRQIHGHVLRVGFDSRVHAATTLVDSYAKIGRVACARRVFDKMPHRNVVSWSAMIACYAKNGRHLDALAIFRDMMRDSETAPNSVTMVSVLQACAGLSALSQGKLMHGYVLRRGFYATVSVVNALIAMYIKCGSLDAGRRVFATMIVPRNVVSWNSLISGYGVHGFGKEAIQVFEEMISVGISPSPVTFVSILGACSHGGLVEEGRRLFDSMLKEHNLIPQSEQYASLVDLLGRAGQLDEATKVIEGMNIEPGPTVWGSLLGACRIHGNIELAERACSHLFELEPWNAGNYILLADIYAAAKLWEEVSRVKKLLEARGLQKLVGCSWIEVKKNLYSFASVDELNPQIEQVHALLTELVKEVREMGYVPNTKVVLYDLEQKEKEKIVLGHSEKLALAFGIISSQKGEVIRITKNLRLCEDCHSLTKFISKYTKREILVRDVNRFHHFRDGMCSCMEYW